MASEGKNLIGVDIGSTSIKVCEIKESGGKRKLIRFGFHPLPPETIVDGHIINSGAVVEGLEKLFHKEKRRQVALRASGHSVIIKKIAMPLMTAAELDEQITWEAEQHIPFDLAEVHIDHQVLRRREDEGQMDVLLVAAKKEEIADLTNLAIEARLKPLVVDLDAFTVQNVFETGYGAPSPGETVVLIHVGASLTTVNILADGTTAFTRDIANGGNYITEQIQKQLGVPFEQAEEFKCQASLGGPQAAPQVTSIIDTVCDSIAGEIQRSLDFFHATSGEPEMHRIFLTGGSSNLPQLMNAVGRRARVGVELVPPLEKIAVEGKDVNPQLLQMRAAQLCVALGLAMRKDRERRT